MKRTKLLALMLIVSITLTISSFQMKETGSQKIGAALGYYCGNEGMSNGASAGLSVAFAFQGAIQGALWGAALGGPVGFGVGLGWSL